MLRCYYLDSLGASFSAFLGTAALSSFCFCGTHPQPQGAFCSAIFITSFFFINCLRNHLTNLTKKDFTYLLLFR